MAYQVIDRDDINSKASPIRISNLEDFSQVGETLRILPFLDVVFVFNKDSGIMYHYKGVFMGWTLYGAVTVKEKHTGESFIKNWMDGIATKEHYDYIVQY